jgi:Purine-nucleoside phosphorylase
MLTHFDEIRKELLEKYSIHLFGDSVVILFWLPRLYRYIKRDLDGSEIKVGFFDVYRFKNVNGSVVNISNASQCIDLINLIHIFDIKRIYGIGLAGSYNKGIGSILIPERAYSEEGLSRYYTKKRYGVFSERMYLANRGILAEFSAANSVQLFCGTIMSLDLFSRETKRFIEMNKKKVNSIDLEVAPFYIMCNYYGIECMAIMILSDLLGTSYFIRENDEIEIVHRIYETMPKLLCRIM